MDDERGSSTVIVAGLIALLCIVGVAVLTIGMARAARHQADAAADLAALAAASALLDGSAEPCTAANEVAARNGATLAGCAIEGQTVRVNVTVAVNLGRWGIGQAGARARAGPVDVMPTG
ncbi:hypothetical protein EK0264_07150 [Epidermidibacterium keratini]|uniref:Putative Flp pilus-assembly TadG-like N-terminal domain-containing protein n=1 Tax=Epidermidibacterium keratini TaxID=1891644 RepID=A0A7L4YUF8_9ACTN|nr:hypothetical protein EK0264_07150 [Epidermidibacterium keratini]